MWLCVGITLEEVPPDTEETWITCDLLLYGGSTTIYGNCFDVELWRKVLILYGENFFSHIFIDGGLHGVLEEKGEVVAILQCLVTKGIIKYGTHLLKRAEVEDVIIHDDPLNRNIFAKFTFIPKHIYSMQEIRLAAEKLDATATDLNRIRLKYELNQSF